MAIGDVTAAGNVMAVVLLAMPRQLAAAGVVTSLLNSKAADDVEADCAVIAIGDFTAAGNVTETKLMAVSRLLAVAGDVTAILVRLLAMSKQLAASWQLAMSRQIEMSMQLCCWRCHGSWRQLSMSWQSSQVAGDVKAASDVMANDVTAAGHITPVTAASGK